LQRGLQQVLCQVFKALRPSDFCRFHVGACGATAAALMFAVAAVSTWAFAVPLLLL
jgi:hypothetical protein